MKRERHLVAYDIRDPKRLRLVHRLLKGHGMPMQYSVFVCDLTVVERYSLMTALAGVVDERHDCVAFVAVGDTDASRFTFMGPKPAFPTGGATIV